jgi:hypothetical protein
MVTIHNRLNQRLIISMTGGKVIELLARDTVSISEKDLESPQLRELINRGEIVVASAPKSGNDGNPEPKPAAETKETKAKPPAGDVEASPVPAKNEQSATASKSGGTGTKTDRPVTTNSVKPAPVTKTDPAVKTNSGKTNSTGKESSPGNTKKK